MSSSSEAGSYLRLTDFVYHSTIGLRVIKKRRLAAGSWQGFSRGSGLNPNRVSVRGVRGWVESSCLGVRGLPEGKMVAIALSALKSSWV